jgi:hypothetical protein
MKRDIFISHAWEDKEDFARQLAERLTEQGFTVWLDEFSLTAGDSLRRSIDRGLARSRFGIVIISKHLLHKEWPKRELDGLAAREVDRHTGRRVILPVWHGIDVAELRSFSPTLADRFAVSSDKGLDHVIEKVISAFRRPKVIRQADKYVVIGGNIGAIGPGARAEEFRVHRDEAEPQTRIIDANLITERFAAGQTATLTVVIRLPRNPIRGKWQAEVLLDASAGPVKIILEVHGFTLLSESPPAVVVPADRDTAPVAFELRIEEESPRWLHILLTQDGRPVGELMINDFSALGRGPTQHTVSSPFRRVAEADLMLLVRAGEGRTGHGP